MAAEKVKGMEMEGRGSTTKEENENPVHRPEKGAKMDEKKVFSWKNREMINWLSKNNYEAVIPQFTEHDIEGRHLPFLNDAYLKEMGCPKVGERIALLEDLRALQTEGRQAWRRQVIMKQDEYRLGPLGGCLPFRCWFFPLCCGPFVPLAEKYVITNQYVSLTHYKPKCSALPGCLLCGYTLEKTNMDLSSVGDVDIASGTPGCCDPMREIAVLSINGESGGDSHTFEFNVRPSQAEGVVEKIHNASIEAVMHQRALRVGSAATESTKKAR